MLQFEKRALFETLSIVGVLFSFLYNAPAIAETSDSFEHYFPKPYLTVAGPPSDDTGYKTLNSIRYSLGSMNLSDADYAYLSLTANNLFKSKSRLLKENEISHEAGKAAMYQEINVYDCQNDMSVVTVNLKLNECAKLEREPSKKTLVTTYSQTDTAIVKKDEMRQFLAKILTRQINIFFSDLKVSAHVVTDTNISTTKQTK